jgi:hypothetical protein
MVIDSLQALARAALSSSWVCHNPKVLTAITVAAIEPLVA